MSTAETYSAARRCCYWQPRFPRNRITVRAFHEGQPTSSRGAQAILDAPEGLLHLYYTIRTVLPQLRTGALLPFALAAGHLDGRRDPILQVRRHAERPPALALDLSSLRGRESVLGTARAHSQSSLTLHPETLVRRLILDDDGLRLDRSTLGGDFDVALTQTGAVIGRVSTEPSRTVHTLRAGPAGIRRTLGTENKLPLRRRRTGKHITHDGLIDDVVHEAGRFHPPCGLPEGQHVRPLDGVGLKFGVDDLDFESFPPDPVRWIPGVGGYGHPRHDGALLELVVLQDVSEMRGIHF